MLSNHQLRFPQRNNPSEAGKKVKNYIYQYSDLIGKGNFAKVYKGFNLNTQQIVAIKLVSLDELKSKHLQALVFQEIRILQMMNHPNILKFHEALLSQRNCYIVTELCNQGSLDDRIKSQIPLKEQQLGNIILGLYSGMKYLREKGVTHRDIKPANVFINNGQLKIADFGLAKFYKQRFHDLDIGSPQYMSPQGIILNNYSEKTDIWSLGITIYELIHGTTPFIECQSEQEMKYNIVRPIPEHRWRKDINPPLRQLINRMLEIDELKRPNVYQLANQPYLRMLMQRQKDISQQIKLTESISLCSFSTNSQQEQRMNNSVSPTHVVTQRPASFSKRVSPNTQRPQNQQLYSTTSSQNSTHSARNIHIHNQNSLNVSMKYLSQNHLEHPQENRFSFAKLNQNEFKNSFSQKNELQVNLNPVSRPYNQISQRVSYSENGKQPSFYRMPTQQMIPVQTQVHFIPHLRQKTSSFQLNTTEIDKKQYSPALIVRSKNYFN